MYQNLRKLVSRRQYQYQPLLLHDEATADVFRLLTLLPGRRGSRISCSLRHASLQSKPVYEALSYTWGNPKSQFNNKPCRGNVNRMYNITLDGRRARIGYNLHAALQQLRQPKQSRILWVDALCINQNDNVERSSQVKLMAKIYGQALEVICWLGESDEYSDIAFDTAEELCWAIKFLAYRYVARKTNVPLSEVANSTLDTLLDQELPDESLRAESPFKSFQTALKRDRLKEALSLIYIDFAAVEDSDQLALSAFGGSRSLARYVTSDQGKLSDYETIEQRTLAITDTFLHRAYWDRLWIVQECFFATKAHMLCGNRQLDFRMMNLWELAFANKSYNTGESLLWKKGDFDAVDNLMSAMGGLTSAYYSRTPMVPFTLAYAMYTNMQKTCSEPRDSVYALLNMVPDVEIDVDYNRQLADIFAETTKTIIRQEQNLNILCMTPDVAVVNRLHRQTSDLPSWIPHFEGPVNSFNLITFNYPFEEQFYKGNGPISPKVLKNVVSKATQGTDKLLAISGVFLGIVTHVEPRIEPFELTDDQLWATLNELLNSTSSKDPNLNIGQFWRTLLIDQYPENTGLRRRIATSAEAMDNLGHDMGMITSLEGMPVRFLKSLAPSLDGKTFCLVNMDDSTASALPRRTVPAMACGNLKIGDLIFVARGATVPFIVRAITDRSALRDIENKPALPSCYSFVGGSYVHGIMDGEGIEAVDGGDLKEEIIYLI